MTTHRSDGVYEAARDAAAKFDYFVLGIVGALCAFIGQQFNPDRLGLNPTTLELLALLTLVASAIAGFRRIQLGNRLIKMNALALRWQEEKGALTSTLGASIINRATGDVQSAEQAAARLAALNEVLPKCEEDLETLARRTGYASGARDWLLLAGFLLLLSSRVWAAYI